MNNEFTVSENTIESFDATDYSLLMLDFKEIYSKISQILPPRNSAFPNLSLNTAIGCEVICAAICHQMNWDFLRNAVYEMTMQDITWISPNKLSEVTPAKITALLYKYNKPERIRAKERCNLLRSIGNSLISVGFDYIDIFLSEGLIKQEAEILKVLNLSKAFSGDPEGKKTQLLLQNLSSYRELSGLAEYCKPAIDYHIIREFLRRGLVKPTNQIARDFIFNPEVQRKESTIAALRKVCSEVFYTLEWLTSYDITTLNTIEWWIGRSVCLKKCPDCGLESESSQWLRLNFEKCPFYDSCYAIQNDCRFLDMVEPTYLGSSY